MRRVVRSWVLAAVCVSAAGAVEPANRQSNPQVKAVLEYHGKRTAAYYAGDEYVDIVGLDAYTDVLDPEHVQGYDEIVALNKPFGFSEYGPHGASNPPGDYDYRRFLEGVKKDFPKTCYFMCWNARWSLATNQNVKEMLSDPAVVNRDELPKELFGVPRLRGMEPAAPAKTLNPPEGGTDMIPVVNTRRAEGLLRN